MKKMIKPTVFGFLALVGIGFSSSALAVPIGLFSTGVDAGGASQAHLSNDTHYDIIAGPIVTGSPVVRTSAGGFPVNAGGWIGDAGDSAWISPDAAALANAPSGQYTYRTTFDLSGFNLSSVLINGVWAADNSGLDILLNGVSLGLTASGFDSFTAFAINSGFMTGVNTLDFVVFNSANGPSDPNSPSGLRVRIDLADGDLAQVAGPAALLLLMTGLVVMRRFGSDSVKAG